MLEAVIFDMDGVIADSEPGYLVAMNRVLERFGRSITAEFHDKVKGNSPFHTWEMILEEVGVRGESPQQLADEMMRIREEIFDREGCRAIPGTIGLMKDLKEAGVRMAVASSAPRTKIERVMTELGIREYLDVSISGSEECRNSKPDPEIFFTAAERLGTEADRCIVIEDAASGIEAAKRAGMHSIRFWDSPRKLEHNEADLVVTKMSDIDVETCRKLVKEE